ncbi:MAG: hypothetical protein E2O84_07745 [Bacteroidetes bacterium]|nr:MAG: hypothetical protein E2O84_07745 [Bacteroidota bacterium]
MGIHKDHILTKDLRDAYGFLLGNGELDSGFDVSETGPSPKRAVKYQYAGKKTNPFAFIVNSGERKEYHLFYLRHPKPGNKELAELEFGTEAVSENPRGEVTIQIRNEEDAQKVWDLVNEVRLK